MKIISSVAPYVTSANALEAVQMAHEDGFYGIELNEDHLHASVRTNPSTPGLIREFNSNKHMINSLHKTLFRPSIDSPDNGERMKAVEYTIKTLDLMESAGIYRMVLHSFSDLPGFFMSKSERADKVGYFIGSNAVKIYGVLAPVLKAYRQASREKFQANFMDSLQNIAKYAADKRVGGKPIEIVFEEHYSDAIDYEAIPYGKGNFGNVIRGIDTAHRLIRTGHDTDLSGITEPIHFHAVDTNGIIDDHRTLGKGKVKFENSFSTIMERNLTNTVVLEDGTRKSVLRSMQAIESIIRRIGATVSSHSV